MAHAGTESKLRIVKSSFCGWTHFKTSLHNAYCMKHHSDKLFLTPASDVKNVVKIVYNCIHVYSLAFKKIHALLKYEN